MKSSLNGAAIMRSQGCRRLVAGALAMLSAGLLGASQPSAEEAARPPREWFDARQHEGVDKAKIDEKLRDEKAWGKESTQPKDLTREPKREFHGLDDLEKLTNTSESDRLRRKRSDHETDPALQKIENLPIKNKSIDVKSSPSLDLSELSNKTRTEIRSTALSKELVPKGDQSHPDFPRRFHDPITGDLRIRLDRGHIDDRTGRPYDNPNAAVDHVHGFDEKGNKITINGDPHIPTKGD